ncbi:MAG: PQQ-binding-like beta-propeller repeat protein [Firmicutes bacterium]|nr:PQQ-binding-like beta-propeller repeat protein [Bacillota bacterium]
MKQTENTFFAENIQTAIRQGKTGRSMLIFAALIIMLITGACSGVGQNQPGGTRTRIPSTPEKPAASPMVSGAPETSQKEVFKSGLNLSATDKNYTGENSSSCPPFLYRYDERRTGRSVNSIPKKPKVIYKIKAEGKINAAASLMPDGGIVFGTLGGKLYIINKDGSFRKKLTLESWIYSSPAVAPDGTIYTACDNGDVVCLSPKGDIKWTSQVPAETSSSPLLLGSKLFLGSEANMLHALTTGGKEIWNFPTKQRILFSSPSADKSGNLYIGAEDNILYQVKSDGTAGWKFKAKGEISLSSPVVTPEGNIVFASSDKQIYCVSPKGKQIWQFTTHEETAGSPALAEDGSVYAAAFDGVLICLNKNGKLKWKRKIADGNQTSPTVDAKGNIIVACKRGIVAVDSKGKTLWNLKNFGGPLASDVVLTNSNCAVTGGDDQYLYFIGD